MKAVALLVVLAVALLLFSPMVFSTAPVRVVCEDGKLYIYTAGLEVVVKNLRCEILQGA